MHFAGDVHEAPILFTWRHEIDAETGHNDFSLRLFLPVYGKRVEVVVLEIHHGEEFIHQSVAQPVLGILQHFGACIPAMTPVSCQIISFSNG